MKVTFKKNERLCYVKKIDELFRRDNPANNSFLVYPLKVIFQKNENVTLPQVLISVPKRRFKRAVDRNLLKRRIREAYRLNKGLLPELPPENIVFVYVANEILDFITLEKAMKKCLGRF